MGVVVVDGQYGGMASKDNSPVMSIDQEVIDASVNRLLNPKSGELPRPGDYCNLYLVSLEFPNPSYREKYIRTFGQLRKNLIDVMEKGGVMFMDGNIVQSPLSEDMIRFMGKNPIASTQSLNVRDVIEPIMASYEAAKSKKLLKGYLVLFVNVGFLDRLRVSFDNVLGKGFPNIYHKDQVNGRDVDICVSLGLILESGRLSTDPIDELSKFTSRRFSILMNPEQSRGNPVLLNPKAALYAIMIDEMLAKYPDSLDFGNGLPIHLGLRPKKPRKPD